MFSKENKDFFTKLVEPLAKSEDIDRMFDEFKRDVLSKLEERIANQDRRIEQLEAELLISKTVSTLLTKTCEATEIKCDDNEQ